VTDLLALTGDAVDNIPGVRGVGPKAAKALLSEFDDLGAIFDDLDRVESLPVRGARGLRKKLEAGREAALLSRRLVRLDHEAPCELGLDDLSYRGAPSAELETFAETWGLHRVADRTPRAEST
jgi:5'-3' exonuclease